MMPSNLDSAEITDTAMVISRVAGIALIALGVACQPVSVAAQALWGMLTYTALITLYLAYLGIEGERVGNLLWPTVVLHALLTFLLAHAWFQDQRTTD